MTQDPLARPEPLIRRVYAYLAFRIGAGPDAEDLTSEVFERAVRYRKTYDSRRGDPAAWLIGIARNVLADAAAHTQRAAAHVPEAEPAQSDGFDDRVLERLLVERAVRLLTPRDQQLIALKYGAELTTRQIADAVSSERGAVDVALHRARGRLAEIFESEGFRDAGKKPRRPTVEGGTGNEELETGRAR
jgi:RNA polymerase sigma-70 factor, ECF subfamily